VRTGLVEANGTKLYHEIRGNGPPVVFVPGAGGDAGGYEAAAQALADTYTIVTYDRRGNSRSPKPDGWTSTSMGEQADDCAALIETLELERPAAFGSSSGGTILVSLLERHPRLLRGAVVHEPGLLSTSQIAAAFTEEATTLLREAMATGGPMEAVNRLNRWMGGDAAWEAVPKELRSRILRNSDVNVRLEAPALRSYEPDAQALAALEIPVHAAYGEETSTANATLASWVKEGAVWVSEASGGPLHALPGGHGAYIDRAEEFAVSLRPILASIS
jgi:pimeloyl-ACP methyl ester carboxylesterase